MTLDLVVVHSPVGGGHKSAALAIAEAARSRGLSVEVLDTFEHAPRVFGQAYVAAHLTWTGVAPELYGAAYFSANHRDGALEPVRRAADHLAWAGLVKRVVELAPRAVVATHHLPLVVLGRARRKGGSRAPASASSPTTAPMPSGPRRASTPSASPAPALSAMRWPIASGRASSTRRASRSAVPSRPRRR